MGYARGEAVLASSSTLERGPDSEELHGLAVRAQDAQQPVGLFWRKAAARI